MNYFVIGFVRLMVTFRWLVIGWVARDIYLEARKFNAISEDTKIRMQNFNPAVYRNLEFCFNIVSKIPFINKTL